MSKNRKHSTEKHTDMEPEIKDESETLVTVKQDDRSSDHELKNGNLMKCRTCLLDKNKRNCSIMTKLLHGETIKSMMIKCVPQTFNSIADDNYICDKCLRCLVKCTNFIDSCLEIEEKIRDGKVIFDFGRTDEKNGENFGKNHTEMDSKSKDDALESISENKEESYEEKFKPKSEDVKTDEIISENEKRYARKDLSESKKVIEDGIESEDSHRIDIKQNELEIKGKRRRKTRKIENSAADEEIEAYLAEEEEVDKKVKSINKRQSKGVKIDDEIGKTPKFVVKKIRMVQHSENDEVLEITLPEIPIEITRSQKRRFVKRENSPKMEIIDKALGMVVRTYQRKKVIADSEGSGVDNQLHSIKNIGEHNETRAKINLRTYERKRNSQPTTNNNEIFRKDHVVLDRNKISKTEKIDCDVISSVNEHTLGSSPQTETEVSCEKSEINKNNDSVHDISDDHDFIVLSEFGNESEKNITLLDENGKLISVDAHVEDIGIHELPEQVEQDRVKIELKCPSCQTHYKTKKGLCGHLEKYHNIRKEYIYHCPVCKKTFMNSKEISTHRNVHGWPCTSCTEMFSSVEELNSHTEVHPQIYSCTECGDELNTQPTLEQHKTMHKLMMDLKPRKAELPPKRYNCNLCPLVFRYPTRLRVHKNIVHYKLKEYGCHDCGKKFGSKRTLEIHHRVKHQDQKPFHCDLCGESFKRADYLKKHSLVHLNEQHSIINPRHKMSEVSLFPSEFCGMVLKKGVGSKKNPYTYAITRKYTCDICGLKFQHQRTKFVHERSHNVDPDKKFICPVCWKRLSTREELDEHGKIHIRISKKYKCWLCPMAFSRNMLLENHILEDHTCEVEQRQELKEEEEADNMEGFKCEDYFDEN